MAENDKLARRALVTGSAGFIGFHLTQRLLREGWLVTGVDGMTDYYDVRLKRARLDILRKSNAFSFHEIMLEDDAALTLAFDEARPDVVVHLAAQAGVRYSLENPRAYVDSNLTGTFNVMEGVRRTMPGHFLTASTSSVYGANSVMPFRETDRTDHPLTLYAATKKANEAMAHSYAHLWGVPTTAFRFFTVYGPWGRPDMALFKFVRGIVDGTPIDIYGEGERWLRKSGQRDEWIVCLMTAMMAVDRRDDEQATTQEPQPCLQGEDCPRCGSRREDAGRAGAAV